MSSRSERRPQFVADEPGPTRDQHALVDFHGTASVHLAALVVKRGASDRFEFEQRGFFGHFRAVRGEHAHDARSRRQTTAGLVVHEREGFHHFDQPDRTADFDFVTFPHECGFIGRGAMPKTSRRG